MNLAISSSSNMELITRYTKIPSLLTEREVEVASWLLSGYSAKEIARFLIISHRTVEKHLDSIKRKFGCRSKLELVTKICRLTTLPAEEVQIISEF